MSARELFTFRNPYFSAAVGLAGGLFVVTAVVGFIVLPYAQKDLQFAGLWDAICSAAEWACINTSGAVTCPRRSGRSPLCRRSSLFPT